MKTNLCIIFQGLGIGLLISPAFCPELAMWNMLGFVFFGIGLLLLPR